MSDPSFRLESMGERSGAQAGRWFAMVERLAASRAGLTIGELAEEFNCTPRTIYRDLKALEDRLGVPLVCEKEEDRTRWKLMDGARYRAALDFTPAELLSLATAERFVEPLSGTAYAAALKTLKSKLKARAGEETAREVAKDAATLDVAARHDYAAHAATIECFRRAIRELRTVEMRYVSLSTGEIVRRVDPYRLWFADGTLYVVGACHVHGGRPRTFAIDRVREARLTEDRFLIPAGFRWEEHVRDSFRVFGGEATRVVVHFSAAVAPLIRSRRWHATQEVIELPGGEVGLAMRVAGVFEVSRWILSFGPHARAVEPTELVRLIRGEIERMYETQVAGERRVTDRMAARCSRK